MPDQKPTDPTAEWLKDVRTLAAQWIASADTKITALLTVAGAVLAIALAGSPQLVDGRLRQVVAGVFAAANILSIVLASAALWPRTDRKGILKARGVPSSQILDNSRTAFTDIGRMNWSTFHRLEELADGGIQDLREQAFVLCVIARTKMWFMRLSVAALTVSFVALAGAVGLILVGVK